MREHIRNYKWDPVQRWLGPDVVEVLAERGIVVDAHRVDDVIRRMSIAHSSSSDALVVEAYADDFVELTRLGIGHCEAGAWADHYGFINLPRRGLTIEEAERLLEALPRVIEDRRRRPLYTFRSGDAWVPFDPCPKCGKVNACSRYQPEPPYVDTNRCHACNIDFHQESPK